MATPKKTSKPSAKKAATKRSLSSLAPPAPAEPETIVEQVRRQHAVIIAAWIEGNTLDGIGNSLEPQLTGYQIAQVFYDDAALKKRWDAAKEFRAHALIDSAGSWATVMGGKDGVEAKLKVAALLAPKQYGAKATLEVTGKDGGPVESLVKLDPSEAYKRMLSGG